MGLFDSPEAPTPPNPMATAAAQTGTNVSTAIANSYLGNVNQNTPQGNLGFDVTSNFNYTDPSTGQNFNIPRWTATQTLNPLAQSTLNQTQLAQGNMANIANQQSTALGTLLSSPMGYTGGTFTPGAYTPGAAATGFNPNAYIQGHSDLAAAFAAQNREDAATWANRHYNEFGRNEGRTIGTAQPATPGSYAAGTSSPGTQIPGFGVSGIAGLGDINWLHQGSAPQTSVGATDPFARDYASGGNITRDFDLGGGITRSYGPADNYSADRQRVEQSMFERVNPQIKQQEDRLRQQLADQGIRYGSEAYAGAYDPFNRGVTDTRLGIVAAGGQEQQRMDEMAARQAGFQNAAQMQAYQQNLGRAGFQNQAQQQAEGQAAARAAFGNQAAQSQFEQAMARGQFFNQAAAQSLGRNQAIFNAQNQMRNQNLQELYQQRGQPINEITALLSGSQVAQPNFINAQRNTIPTTDVAGLINQNFAQSNDLYKTGMSSWNDIIGGALGAAGQVGAGYMRSDVRSKENIAPMGSILSPKGELPIYAYDYKNDTPDGQRHVGPMAQDVERIDPSAVKSFGGVKHIKRDKLGSIFGNKAA